MNVSSGYVCGVTTVSVSIPRFRQKQILVDECMKVVNGVCKMNGHDAIFFLADGAAVLPLYAGRFGAFLDETGFVDDADGVFSGLFFGDDFLEFVSHLFVIPFLLGEKPLDGSWRYFSLEGDGFTLFTGEGGRRVR
jgi:hypothetical protein